MVYRLSDVTSCVVGKYESVLTYLSAKSSTKFITSNGFASLISLAAFNNFVCSGNASTKNQGSMAMQWPPTPQRGFKMLTRGCLFAKAIKSYGLMPCWYAIEAT